MISVLSVVQPTKMQGQLYQMISMLAPLAQKPVLSPSSVQPPIVLSRERLQNMPEEIKKTVADICINTVIQCILNGLRLIAATGSKNAVFTEREIMLSVQVATNPYPDPKEFMQAVVEKIKPQLPDVTISYKEQKDKEGKVLHRGILVDWS